MDLENIKTPVDVEMFEQLLNESKYDKEETRFLINGFRHEFCIGYKGDEEVKLKAPNLKFRGVGNPTELWNKVMKEVKEERYAGPFESIPFEHYI